MSSNASHAKKATENFKYSFNILNFEDNFIKDIIWKKIKEWKCLSEQKNLF